MKNGKGERNKKSDINLTKLNSTATRVVYWMFQILNARSRAVKLR